MKRPISFIYIYIFLLFFFFPSPHPNLGFHSRRQDCAALVGRKLPVTYFPNRANEWSEILFTKEKKRKQEEEHNHNHAATAVLNRGRVTSYLVLFWYLSLRNSSTYSDPSVWGGSFTDEVRLLTAMKQYLKQIKRHFPQLDSCRATPPPPSSPPPSRSARCCTTQQKADKKKIKKSDHICFSRYRNKTALSRFLL